MNSLGACMHRFDYFLERLGETKGYIGRRKGFHGSSYTFRYLTVGDNGFRKGRGTTLLAVGISSPFIPSLTVGIHLRYSRGLRQ